MKSIIGILIGVIFSLFVYLGAGLGLVSLGFVGIVLTIVLYVTLLCEGGLGD